MKKFAIAVALLGFLVITAPAHAQRKFDVPPHPPAGWSGPIGAPPKKDKDSPKKDKDGPKKDKNGPQKDKENPKKDKQSPKEKDPKKDAADDRAERLKDARDRIDNAVDRARRLYEENRRTNTDYTMWYDFWDIVLIELPALVEAYDKILAEIPGHLPPP